ncbi:MAG: DUF4625 domain-containing protein [Tannerellaceae bacterium]|jgi:uncharacterized membrane protein|nr:DUF4625 domain-containing protein [Tannerellaceae bacterium]
MKPIICFFTICLTAIPCTLFVSCDNDEDTTKPVINLIEPEEGDVLQIGSDVHFEMELSDNDLLRSYKVDIHHNFDGHTHTSATKAGEETIPFSYSHAWDISGQKNASIHHHEILIPENATPGDYHLVVYCTDASGNESYVAINIELSHDGEEHEH